MEKTLTLDGDEVSPEYLDSGRIKGVIDSFKLLTTKTGKEYARFKIVDDSREFTTWDSNVATNLMEGNEIDFLFNKKINEYNGVTYTNYNVSEVVVKPEDTPGLSRDTKELIKQCVKKIEDKELETEIEAVGRVQEELNKDPLKYDDSDFKKMVDEVDKVREENKVNRVKVSEAGVVTTQIDITNKDLEQREIVVPGIVIKKPGTYTLVLGLA